MFLTLSRPRRKPKRGALDVLVAPRDNQGPARPGVDGRSTWVVMPTFNEFENLAGISAAVLKTLPLVTLLIVDDGSPDGTGSLADRLAANDSRVVVRHRTAKEGLGRAYLEGFRVALAGGAQIVVQMDADWSHDPDALPALILPILRGEADLVIGSRYAAGGRVTDWPWARRVISRSGSLFARVVLQLKPRDLTGGFKAWRSGTLESVPFEGVHAGGYVFQIEMTYRATRLGARVREIPITFRERIAGKSKMSRRIVLEALIVVVRLRMESLPGRIRQTDR